VKKFVLTCATSNFHDPDGLLESQLVIAGDDLRQGRQEAPLVGVQRCIPRRVQLANELGVAPGAAANAAIKRGMNVIFFIL